MNLLIITKMTNFPLCKKCDEEFKTSDDYEEHLEQEHNVRRISRDRGCDDTPYSCSNCPYTCNRMVKLKTHLYSCTRLRV